MKNKKFIIGCIIVLIISIIILLIVLIKLNDKNNMQNTIMEDENLTNKIDEKTYVQSLYDEYLISLYDFPQLIYNHLDSEYKHKRFSDEEAFYKYIECVINNSSTLTISNYNKNEYTDYIQYVIKDSEKNSIIFNIKSSENYTLILDNHTIIPDSLKKQYKMAQNKEKVNIIIENILDAFNTYDYEYIYDRLEDNFKQKYFNTLNSFIEYFEDKPIKGLTTSVIDYSEKKNKFIQKIGIGEYTIWTIEFSVLDISNFKFSFKIENLIPKE